MAMRFVPYHLLGETPNVVVDGSPSPSTRLTLSHWPGSPTPTDLRADLSAEIAFRALQRPDLFDGVDAVSNNHFDQDGLASAFALLYPQEATARRDQVVDVASAGDFATFRDRDSMRIAMAIAAHDDPDRSPLDCGVFSGAYDEQCGALYLELLPRFVEMLDHPERYRSLWEGEDAHLTESLDAIDAGDVRLTEHHELDLAVCEVPDPWAHRAATRFTMGQQAALHPAAVPNRTSCMRVITSHDGDHRLECRYETWVMFTSRPLAPRPDLRPLAARLDEVEGRATWRADAPDSLTPGLRPKHGTTLTLPTFLDEVGAYLRTAPPAWDPFART